MKLKCKQQIRNSTNPVASSFKIAKTAIKKNTKTPCVRWNAAPSQRRYIQILISRTYECYLVFGKSLQMQLN